MRHQAVVKPIPAPGPEFPANRRRIAEEAVEWIDRLQEIDEKEKVLFAEWLRVSPRHIEAFLKACVVQRELDKIGKAKALSKTTADVVVDHPAVVLSEAAATTLFARAAAPAAGSDAVAYLGSVYRDYPGLRALILKQVRDPEVTADILQDAAVTTLEKLRSGEFTRPENVGGYLYRVALTHLRARRRCQHLYRYGLTSEQLERFADDEVSPEFQFGLPQWSKAASRMLAEMSPTRDRDLLVRFYLNDEAKEQICQDLQLSQEHFNRVIFRARNRFRQLLVSRGFEFDYQPQKPAGTRVFVSYDCRDRGRLNEFHGHLANLREEGVITAWADREISAGTSTGRDASSKLDEASLFVPLVSSELLNSRYCYDLEMTRAMTLHESGHLQIAPVILEDCDWRRSPFGQFKPLPQGKPIGAWPNEGAAFEEVIAGLRARLEAPRDFAANESKRAMTQSAY